MSGDILLGTIITVVVGLIAVKMVSGFVIRLLLFKKSDQNWKKAGTSSELALTNIWKFAESRNDISKVVLRLYVIMSYILYVIVPIMLTLLAINLGCIKYLVKYLMRDMDFKARYTSGRLLKSEGMGSKAYMLYADTLNALGERIRKKLAHQVLTGILGKDEKPCSLY